MYNFSNTLIMRKSCRKYVKGHFLTTNQKQALDYAAYRAPHCSPHSHVEIKCIEDQATKDEIMAACMDQYYVGECSAVYVFLGTEPDKKLRSGFAKFASDCYIACSYMHLMATSIELGSVIIGNFIPERVQNILKTKLRPTIILLVGQRREDPPPPPEPEKKKNETSSTID